MVLILSGSHGNMEGKKDFFTKTSRITSMARSGWVRSGERRGEKERGVEERGGGGESRREEA